VGMTHYRANIVGHDGNVIGHRGFICDNDNDAVAWANQLIGGHDIELWSEDRFVIRLHFKPQ
jgi:hypothetical protein